MIIVVLIIILIHHGNLYIATGTKGTTENFEHCPLRQDQRNPKDGIALTVSPVLNHAILGSLQYIDIAIEHGPFSLMVYLLKMVMIHSYDELSECKYDG